MISDPSMSQTDRKAAPGLACGVRAYASSISRAVATKAGRRRVAAVCTLTPAVPFCESSSASQWPRQAASFAGTPLGVEREMADDAHAGLSVVAAPQFAGGVATVRPIPPVDSGSARSAGPGRRRGVP